jgi:hypothetical protein
MTALGGLIVGVIVALVFVFHAIHQSRVTSARYSCEATNAEHIETIKGLERKLEQLEPTLPPAQREQLSQTKAFTISLISSLAPLHGDCNKYANEVVK